MMFEGQNHCFRSAFFLETNPLDSMFYAILCSFLIEFIHKNSSFSRFPMDFRHFPMDFPWIFRWFLRYFLPGTEYYVMYLAWSASGEGRSQMGAIVPVGINRVDVWVDTPLEAQNGANRLVFGWRCSF